MYYLKKRDKDDTKFLAMLAHDLKTPVKAQIRALNLVYAGALGEVNEEIENIVKNLIASNKYLQCLIDSVLSEYRLNSGSFVLNKTKNDIRKTLEEALRATGILFDTKEQKISVKYLSDNYICNYDEIEMKRVFINLLSNAFEYSKEKSHILITATREADKIKFQIQSSSAIKQSKDSFSCYKKGTGLGLSICEQILEMHEGDFAAGVAQDDEYISGLSLPLCISGGKS